jgi:hypothetical protein
MKQLMLIIGVVLLSGTNAFAAQINFKDGARQTLETLPGSLPREVTLFNASTDNNSFAPEGRSDSVTLRRHLIEAGYDQDDAPGAPGRRGAGR